MSSISIIGCGTLGKLAAHLFLNVGIHVKLLVRMPEAFKDLKVKGAEIFQGDMTSKRSLQHFCKGAEVILTTVHGMMGRGNNSSKKIDDQAHCSLISIAKDEGVPQFIYTSVAGASPDHPIDFWRTKFKVEQWLKESGINYTILRPTAFIETHMHFLIGKSFLKKGKVNMFGNGKNVINFISAADVVKVIRMVYKNEAYYNQTIELGGPDNISRNEVVQLYEKYSGKTAKVSHLPLTVVKFLSKIISPFHEGISRIMKVGVSGETIEEKTDNSLTIARFGFAPTPAEEFIKNQISFTHS